MIIAIEDTHQHAEDARTVADIVVANYAEFELELAKERPEAILSDLYFPTGYAGEKDASMRNESARMIDGYLARIDRYNPVGHAVDAVLSLSALGTTLDEFLATMKNDPVVDKFKDRIRTAYAEHTKTKEYQLLKKMITDGSHDPPSGIFVYRHAKELNIPCIIVTSAYHHGPEFQPFVHLVGQYTDNLVDGKKPWKQALEMLQRQQK